MKKKLLLPIGCFLFFVQQITGQILAIPDHAFLDEIPGAQIAIPNVLANDLLNGSPATLANVTLTQIEASPGLVLLPDGSVQASPVVGIYNPHLTYEICEIANPNNCTTAHVSVYNDNWLSISDPTITVTTPPTCTNPTATITIGDFDISESGLYVYLYSDGVLAGQSAVDEFFPTATFTNVPTGVLFFALVDFEEISTYYIYDYLPDPTCDFNLAFSGAITDSNSNGITDVGDTIQYQFTINNSAPDTLTNVTVSSATLGIQGGPIATMLPGATDTTTFTASYSLTQEDINVNQVTHYAMADALAGAETMESNAQAVTLLNAPDGIRMSAFFDSNFNGIMDADENFISGGYVGSFQYEINGSGNPHQVQVAGNAFTLYESNPSNTYHLTMVIHPWLTQHYVANVNFDVTVQQGSGITTYLFPVSYVPTTNFYAWIAGQQGIRPGFASWHQIRFGNYGNVPIVSGTLDYNPDAHLSLTEIPAGAVATPTGFQYPFFNLQPGEMRTLYVHLQAPPVPTIAIGDQLVSSVAGMVTSPNEINLENNQDSVSQTVGNSWDPNDISESHGPRIVHADFSTDNFLTYTIRFENTGNVDAIDIRIEDQLDGQLDETTAHTLDASHNYVMTRTGNQLVWRFDGIHLDPSVEGTNTGHGYVTFEIKPKPGYAVGDIIPNSADIYFDFNPAITTNTFETEFVETLGNATFTAGQTMVFPNPVTDVLHLKTSKPISATLQITDLLGKTLRTQTFDGNATIDLSGLSQGMYLVKISSPDQTQTHKIVKR
ncbi:T9SS type A sorting domain-containing protein [Flavobacterium caeni]|uniref:Conserved repeat domain-containing protein/Por secretion system C-terminal sorting domain-containing protein n=1 Tax=Flavobacterium caeni TaxID=490189 RepID=A0A1G5EJX0_9FLAO|nr:T9SS type A sorting domain-containing protein [Flavobacterium caeni]SCY27266.1 conserved repeat domain-containing protein/Por secretion system C-terminal sorting domain-containing protein [Flavobacterium caeni]